MTLEQYGRWKDFAFRMVNVAVSARKRAPSRADVREQLEFFFECRINHLFERIQNWDSSKPDEHGRFDYVCDSVSDMSEYWIPNYWSICDRERAYEKAEERWCGAAQACLRAGLDVACSPSAGVTGFTAGDIRVMFPEGVPDWVKGFFKPRPFDELPDEEPIWL